MKRKRNRAVIFLSCTIIIFSLCSWGFYVHETATQLAVYKLPKPLQRFFFANIDSVTANSIQPDKRRYTDKTEAAKHFIDIENYGNGAIVTMPHDLQSAVEKYSWDTLKRYGYVPYQITIEYDSLVNAFKHNNSDSILFYAADLAHYIEDANVPLHTTNNYDGQLTNQKGLHALWESTIPELELGNYNLHSKHSATYVKDKAEIIWMALRRAHILLPEMLEKEKEVAANFPDSSKYVEKMYYGKKTKVYTNEFAKQYAAALTTTINDQLNYCSDMVADFWYSAWVDAGKPTLKNLYNCTHKNRKQLRKEIRDYKRIIWLKTACYERIKNEEFILFKFTLKNNYMETIIKVNPSELDTKLLDKIKSLIGNNTNVDVTISLNEYDPLYNDDLNKSIYQAEENENIQSFTMEDLMNYSPAKTNE